jgi:hypothetical protein
MSYTAIERVVEFLEMDQEAEKITDTRPPSEVTLISYVPLLFY